jgi:hypothetical protein
LSGVKLIPRFPRCVIDLLKRAHQKSSAKASSIVACPEAISRTSFYTFLGIISLFLCTGSTSLNHFFPNQESASLAKQNFNISTFYGIFCRCTFNHEIGCRVHHGFDFQYLLWWNTYSLHQFFSLELILLLLLHHISSHSSGMKESHECLQRIPHCPVIRRSWKGEADTMHIFV